mgnify:CR=1 FL=1
MHEAEKVTRLLHTVFPLGVYDACFDARRSPAALWEDFARCGWATPPPRAGQLLKLLVEAGEGNCALMEVSALGWPFLFVVTTRPVAVGAELVLEYGAHVWRRLEALEDTHDTLVCVLGETERVVDRRARARGLGALEDDAKQRRINST